MSQFYCIAYVLKVFYRISVVIFLSCKSWRRCKKVDWPSSRVSATCPWAHCSNYCSNRHFTWSQHNKWQVPTECSAANWLLCHYLLLFIHVHVPYDAHCYIPPVMCNETWSLPGNITSVKLSRTDFSSGSSGTSSSRSASPSSSVSSFFFPSSTFVSDDTFACWWKD